MHKLIKFKLLNFQEVVYKQICVLENSDNSKDSDSLNSRELLSNVATSASLLKYDFQIAKTHFIQQLFHTGMFFFFFFIYNSLV